MIVCAHSGSAGDHMARRSVIPQLCAAVLLASGTAGVAQAQGFDFRSLFQGPSTTGTATPAEQSPAKPSGPEWSGESGASGHPTMTAAAIRAAAANFRGCLERLWPLAARRNVPRAVYDRYVTGADAGPADHGSDGLAARVHQVVLGISRYPGQRAAGRQRPCDPGEVQGGIRHGREGLRRGPALRRGNLGRGVRTTAPRSANAR